MHEKHTMHVLIYACINYIYEKSVKHYSSGYGISNILLKMVQEIFQYKQ